MALTTKKPVRFSFSLEESTQDWRGMISIDKIAKLKEAVFLDANIQPRKEDKKLKVWLEEE